ncbi:hypothetical protein METBIDRAFT_80269 [Metschnikowia bicuspidata var. bicuspidata NRRL YB-4993]|uniref:Uncharacterized protein n=1 Tax=Metschnikowia bicuspidata var. bicuspidata NRRL YB-4993 TaxID=869754 RepID=A0A1A0HFC1_9ASCO|nr:hypothetical protein METBIDRAFT_80269 [Metschnikowia bicuspidata var. bicuspidata NRRL YB-4993]OBA22696.1 hypothetical protein METBIDRAFT_80269 [Metschnikowia bicuspidata var. bicuspidata NRRL YB-4993]
MSFTKRFAERSESEMQELSKKGIKTFLIPFTGHIFHTLSEISGVTGVSFVDHVLKIFKPEFLRVYEMNIRMNICLINYLFKEERRLSKNLVALYQARLPRYIDKQNSATKLITATSDEYEAT